MDNIEIDSDQGIVLIWDETEVDPNGEPIIVEYTIEEWNKLHE